MEPLQLTPQKQKMEQPDGLAIDTYYNPARLNAMVIYAEQMVASAAFGGSIKNKFQALAILQAGAECGLAPMESIGAFYIVNGKVTMYGAAMSKQLRRHGWKIEYLDEVPGKKVTVKITKGEESYSYTAESTDPVLARSQAFKNDAYSKLRWHALGRLLRFNAPEAMGSVAYIAEEMEEDVTVSVMDPVAPAPATRKRVVKKAFDGEPEAPVTCEAKEVQEPELPEGWVATEEPTEPQPKPALAPLEF